MHFFDIISYIVHFRFVTVVPLFLLLVFYRVVCLFILLRLLFI